MPIYAKPTNVDEALALLAERKWRMLAGGTDFYPAQGARPICDDVLDLNGLTELRGIAQRGDDMVIGARTTWTDIVRADLPTGFDALKQAAREVGSIQIQNVGTIAGNLCNASPAADGAPPLLALNAEVELRSAGSTRLLPLSNFLLGNRKTARRSDEMVTSVKVAKADAEGVSAFVKLGARRYLVISIAMAAARLVIDGGRIAQAAVAVGSCSAVAQRLRGLEAELVGQSAVHAAEIAYGSSPPELAPIDDVRGSAGYRLDAAREIVARALTQAGGAGRKAAA